MKFLKYFYLNKLRYNISNKFLYSNIKKLPKIKKIILNFGCKTTEIKKLAASLLALKLIAHKKGKLTKTSQSNILLKIRKGSPTGCKITLRKSMIFNFLTKTLNEIFPKTKNFTGFLINKINKKNAFSYNLYETFTFTELEEHYHIFKDLPKLHITIVTNTKNKNELIFLLKSFHFPFKK